MNDVKLHLSEEFDARYEAYLTEGNGQRWAWERTEADYKRVFGQRRYSSYDSYRRVRYRNRKKHRNAAR